MEGIISLDKLKNIKTIYYHGSCPDGITAREILKYATLIVDFRSFYFTELKHIPSNALFIDCSPKAHQVEACLKNGCVIAEHHESFTESYCKFNEAYPGTMILGDTSKAESGAILAWAIVDQIQGCEYLPDYVRAIARLIAIGDTWQKDDPNFEYARMLGGYIAFFGNDFCMDLRDLADGEEAIKAFGYVQKRKQEMLARGAIRYTEGKVKLAFINELNMSNAAEILRSEDDIDIVVGYITKYDNLKKKNIVIFSLRSKENGFDCAAFCKRLGGGGHKAAAGYSVPWSTTDPIYRFMKDYIEATDIQDF